MSAHALRAHCLQHVSFEGLGSIAMPLAAHGARVGISRLYEVARLPRVSDFDVLIVMGGPMSVNDETRFPWLAAEKRLIAAAMDAGRHVLGICLGAQLVASACGARVTTNREREIGWYPLQRTSESPLAACAVPEFPVFHWHGETYALPANAERLARSAGCEQQAFAIGDRVLALQFHLEMTPAGAQALVDACPADLAPATYVQTAAEMLSEAGRFARINAAMDALLAHWLPTVR